MLPPDNNDFSPEARIWRILNIEQEELSKTLPANSLTKYANDSPIIQNTNTYTYRKVNEKMQKFIDPNLVSKEFKNNKKKRFIAFDYTPDGKLLGVEGRGRREALEEFILEEHQRGLPEIDKELEPYMLEVKLLSHLLI